MCWVMPKMKKLLLFFPAIIIYYNCSRMREFENQSGDNGVQNACNNNDNRK